MKPEERVRLLRDVGHDVAMSCCILTLDQMRVREVSFRLRQGEQVIQQVVVIPLEGPNWEIDRAMHQCIDEVLTRAKLP